MGEFLRCGWSDEDNEDRCGDGVLRAVKFDAFNDRDEPTIEARWRQEGVVELGALAGSQSRVWVDDRDDEEGAVL